MDEFSLLNLGTHHSSKMDMKRFDQGRASHCGSKIAEESRLAVFIFFILYLYNCLVVDNSPIISLVGRSTG